MRVPFSWLSEHFEDTLDVDAVADKLSDVVTQLRSTSRTLKTATGEILSGANDLSERTTKQAATIDALTLEFLWRRLRRDGR